VTAQTESDAELEADEEVALGDGVVDCPVLVMVTKQVRFCRYRCFPCRRLRIQGGQGRGGFGFRFTV
jgi:hypothetical protein